MWLVRVKLEQIRLLWRQQSILIDIIHEDVPSLRSFVHCPASPFSCLGTVQDVVTTLCNKRGSLCKQLHEAELQVVFLILCTPQVWPFKKIRNSACPMN